MHQSTLLLFTFVRCTLSHPMSRALPRTVLNRPPVVNARLCPEHQVKPRVNSIQYAQVSGLKASGEQTRRLTGAVSDFEMTVAAAFSGRLLAQHDSGKLVDGAIIAVKNFQCSEVEGAKKIMVLDLDVAGKYRGADLPKLATPASAGAALANFPPVSPSECAFVQCGIVWTDWSNFNCLVDSTHVLHTC